MATSFLQFCTTCENQIITPDNSVLYCSRKCRFQDNKSLARTGAHTNTTNYQSENPLPAHLGRGDLPHKFSSSECLTTSSARTKPCFARSITDVQLQPRRYLRLPSNTYAESEASLYLRQFVSNPYIPGLRARRRPLASRSTTSISTLTTASTVASVMTSSAPSALPTPASSYGGSAPLSSSSELPMYSSRHRYIDYSRKEAGTNTRSIELIIPVLRPKDNTISASVPSIRIESENFSESKSERLSSSAKIAQPIDHNQPIAATNSMPTQWGWQRISQAARLSCSVSDKPDYTYEKRTTLPCNGKVQGGLKQLLSASVT